MSTASLLRDVVRLYTREQRKQAKCRDGASNVQCHVLTEMYREEGLTQQALAERLGLDKGWISRAVDALVAEECVARRPNPADRRSTVLSLTETGQARAARLENELNSHAFRLLDGLPAAYHPQIEKSLQMLLDALSHPQPCVSACTTPHLRPASSSDWAGIERLLRAEGLPLDGAQECLGDFIVGEEGGTIVCAAGLEIYGNDALLRSVVVASAARGQSLAKRMVVQLAEQAYKRNVKRLYLLTTSAASYFSQIGFEVIDRRELPDCLRESRELQGACPASATAMAMAISQ
jgi:amino-acid N-acetyltransferase